MSAASDKSVWMLDSSTFIHVVMIDRLQLLSNLRTPLCFPEYVYRFELGVNAKLRTRQNAKECVRCEQVTVQQLTLEDLERIAELEAPRRIGLGEIACAIIAERNQGGVLCDDRRAKNWLCDRISGSVVWEDTEDFLLNAADLWHISEFDLEEFQSTLRDNLYVCRIDLRQEHLFRLHARNTKQ
ncbi:hypothetical protein [Thalassoglobus polymorphus]|uniref:PIN domain-containing protein n=1 Tax=Thalassoglobus polymorphus TaxID=2527994 RepID=A0A517QK64_9PLAN|nr:hypothetical protein [Thalassoglobus polymorphus]QDT32005.1 hypothetical protein Mal48_12440 [Thalassoglobus polymorphus]